MSDSINNYVKNAVDATFIEISEEDKNKKNQSNENKKMSNEDKKIDHLIELKNKDLDKNNNEVKDNIEYQIEKNTITEKEIEESNIYSENIIFTNKNIIDDFSEDEYKNDIKLSLDKVNCEIKELNNKIERVNNESKEDKIKNNEKIKKLSQEIFIKDNNIEIKIKKSKMYLLL